MKIRKGFVSNSSSSSFTCDVCGEEVSGWDMGISEAEMFSCVNGHTVCCRHEVEILDEEKQLMLLNYTDKYAEDKGESVRKKAQELIDSDDECAWEEYFDEMFEDWDYEAPEERCPICQFKEISTRETIKYLLKKNGVTEEDLMKEMRERFSNYGELRDFLKNKKDKE